MAENEIERWAKIQGKCAVGSLVLAGLGLPPAWYCAYSVHSSKAPSNGGPQMTTPAHFDVAFDALIIFYMGALILGFGWLVVRGKKRHAEASNTISPTLPVKDDIEADQRRREKIQLEAELWRAQESARICGEEKRKVTQESDEVKARHAIFAHFTPLQIDALTLSHDINQFLNDFEEKPPLLKPGSSENKLQIEKRYEWSMRLEAGYKRRFEARDREISLRFSEEGINVRIGGEPKYIDERYRLWAEELIALAYKIDGIVLSVGVFQ